MRVYLTKLHVAVLYSIVILYCTPSKFSTPFVVYMNSPTTCVCKIFNSEYLIIKSVKFHCKPAN